MAPSEESILANFLLAPSSLPNVISLEKFAKLFPRHLQSHPQVKTLYHELQHIRAQDIDLIRENIDKELKRGEKQKEELKTALATRDVSGMDRNDQLEIEMDVQLFGQQSTADVEDVHTLDTLLPEMERAKIAMEKEIKELQAEASAVYGQISGTVGELSDLRYGKFNRPSGASETIAEETIRGLENLENACQR